jgi:hypothetical protein
MLTPFVPARSPSGMMPSQGGTTAPYGPPSAPMGAPSPAPGPAPASHPGPENLAKWIMKTLKEEMAKLGHVLDEAGVALNNATLAGQHAVTRAGSGVRTNAIGGANAFGSIVGSTHLGDQIAHAASVGTTSESVSTKGVSVKVGGHKIF